MASYQSMPEGPDNPHAHTSHITAIQAAAFKNAFQLALGLFSFSSLSSRPRPKNKRAEATHLAVWGIHGPPARRAVFWKEPPSPQQINNTIAMCLFVGWAT